MVFVHNMTVKQCKKWICRNANTFFLQNTITKTYIELYFYTFLFEVWLVGMEVISKSK